MAPSKYQDPHGPKVEPPPRFADERQLQEYEEQQEEAHPVSSGPYRVNTTGLSTDHLPPPPVRRDGGSAGRSPPSYDSVVNASPSDAKAPSLPPRLPPRSGSGTPDRTASPMSTLGVSSRSFNQGAVSRLGAAGISVPAFGIGSSSSPSHAHADDDDDDEVPPPKPPRPVAAQPPPSHLNELQNRFARLGTSTPDSSTPTSLPVETHAVAQTQQQAPIRAAVAAPSPSASPGLAGKKKPPPPPPKKKPSLAAAGAPAPGNGAAPPPIPLSTRPSY